MSTEVVETANTGGLVDDVLSTQELHTPPAEPDAHQGEIVGLSLETFDSGATAIKVILKSNDDPNLAEENLMIFLPKAFVEDILVNPNTLPEEEGNKQQTQYRIAIANDTKDANVQQLRAIAYEQGRTLEGATKPTNIQEFTELLANLLSGIQVVFVRRPDKNADDPRFKNRLRVKSIYPPTIVNKPPKSWKKMRLMWEVNAAA